MKRTVLILLTVLLALGAMLSGCAREKQPEFDDRAPHRTDTAQKPPEPEDTDVPRVSAELSDPALDADFPEGFYAIAEDDYVRYTGGGISVLMEWGFAPESAQDGSIIYTNGYLSVVISHTDDYDAGMLAQNGYDTALMSEEDYAMVLIDTNKMNTDSCYADWCGNVCLDYGGGAANYLCTAVIKKNPADNTFWLIQYIGPPRVFEPYSVYFPQWAEGTLFPY